jgi:hypothetical protein
MGSIPLPALDLKPPQPQQNPLEQYGNLLQLKNAQQEQQLHQQLAPLQIQQAQQGVQSQGLQVQQQQQALRDQQGVANWYKNIDPSDPDAFNPIKVGKTLAANGVSGSGIMDTQQKLLQRQQTMATLSKDQIANNQAVSDNLSHGIDGVLSLTDPTQRAQAIVPLLQTAVQNKLIDPAQAQQLEANPGAVTNDQLQQFQHGLGVSAAFMKAAAAKQSAQYKVVNGTLYDMSGQQPTPALAGQLNPQQWGQLVDSTVPPTGTNAALNARTKSMVNFALSRGDTQAAQQAIAAAASQVGDIEKQTNPEAQAAKIQVANAEGNARAQAYGNLREYPVYDHATGQTVYVPASQLNAAPPGRYTAPNYTPESLGAKDATNYFVQGKGGQQVTAFNTSIAHLDTFSKLANDLGNSNLQVFNKAAQAWAQQTGNPAPTNFAAAKNAMSGEVASALKASGATDQEIEKVGATFDRAQSPAQLQGAIGTYRNLLQSKVHNLEGQYDQGMQGKPNFTGSQQPSSGLTVTAPNGKTYSFKDQASVDAFKKNAGIQ